MILLSQHIDWSFSNGPYAHDVTEQKVLPCLEELLLEHIDNKNIIEIWVTSFLMMLRLLLLLPILVHCGKAGSSQRRLMSSMVTSVINRKPNIVFILTDDQDLLLGSMSAMNKTKYHLGQHGANFINAFVTSPMCCPSRSSILTGQYVHNHKVYSNVESYCGAPHWRRGPEGRNFGAYMQAASYRTGYFGKYLNNYDGSYIPPGWTEWAGLIGNSKYYKYAINHNGQIVRHGLDYESSLVTPIL
ncbi:Extracellular sulfatase Sulf-2 [Holothuria leucospilota]|uniref:Extracellular sulfatase Sulf-2 n=1 Tax=Holothuria leucospilota TaxID=206669 RepID=A0A9Q1BD19_HOLLE|nr:Extracellular sulfatase Sulf-2 [Holothuria leucospilota]